MERRLVDALVRIIVYAVAISLTAYLLPGVSIAQHNVGTILLLGLVIGIVNGVIRPIAKFLTMPISFVTLGLFHFVLNALLLLLVSAIVPALHFNGFLDALIGGVVLGILAAVLEWIVNRLIPETQPKRR